MMKETCFVQVGEYVPPNIHLIYNYFNLHQLNIRDAFLAPIPHIRHSGTWLLGPGNLDTQLV